MRETADRLLALAEKARHVDRTLGSIDRTRSELESLVDAAVDSGGHDSAATDVVVDADEPFVSEPALAALQQGTEEALQHTAGLGLWVANWILDEGNGALELPGDGPADRVKLTTPTVVGE